VASQGSSQASTSYAAPSSSTGTAPSHYLYVSRTVRARTYYTIQWSRLCSTHTTSTSHVVRAHADSSSADVLAYGTSSDSSSADVQAAQPHRYISNSLLHPFDHTHIFNFISPLSTQLRRQALRTRRHGTMGRTRTRMMLPVALPSPWTTSGVSMATTPISSAHHSCQERHHRSHRIPPSRHPRRTCALDAM
jgi:hypothetical protein